MIEPIWSEATERLRHDPDFGPLVERVGPVRLPPRSPDAFTALVSSIVYQQLAGTAARTIHGRLVDALEGDVRPATVLATPEPALLAAGLSRNKLAAIRDLARRLATEDLPADGWESLSDQAVTQRLVRVRGIGDWTAQMFLLFHLRRPDVWPTGDRGVRAGLGRVLGLPQPPSPADTGLIGTGYRPWRSAVAWYCWRAASP